MAATRSKRKVKVSKNKKKSWNKFCDIKEVEEFLEEKRFEERIGGRLSEKPNEEVFFVDRKSETGGSVRSKKILRGLKCHQATGSYSCVPIPVNVNANRYPRRIQISLERAAEKRFKKFAKYSKKEHSTKATESIIDPWAEEEEVDSDIRDLIAFRDEYTEKKTPRVPSHRFQKPSLLPAVEVPHPGASYNPDYDSHQELLQKAVDVEVKHVNEELHLKRVLNDMFPSKADAPTAKSRLEEMSQGLFDDDDDDEEEDTQKDNCLLLRNPPVLAEDRLPKSRKRKRKELKEEAKRRVVERKNKQRRHEIYRLPSIKKEIKKDQEISNIRQQRNLQRRVDKMYNPRTLSSQKYEAPDIEVNLTEEITGSLRTLKTDGNILEDRFKSLQRRNIIETRTRQKIKRKYKLKLQVRRTHRD